MSRDCSGRHCEFGASIWDEIDFNEAEVLKDAVVALALALMIDITIQIYETKPQMDYVL